MQVAAPPLAAVAGLVQVRTLVCFPVPAPPPQGPMQLPASDHGHLRSMFDKLFCSSQMTRKNKLERLSPGKTFLILSNICV